MSRIFISSTSSGLLPYRQIATEVIAAQGFEPVVQEHFATPNSDIADEIRQKVFHCNGVVALVGPYYGEPFPVEDDGLGLSYSQFELEFALRQNLPCLAAIAADDCDLEDGVAEDSALRDQQAAFAASLKTRMTPRLGWSSFGNRFQFAMVLAKIRWTDWLRV